MDQIEYSLKDLPIRSEIKSRKLYGAPQLPVDIKLNVNENPYGLTAELQEEILTEIQSLLNNINRYPNNSVANLRKVLAKYLSETQSIQIAAENIVVGNGSNEMLQLVFQLFGGNGKLALGFSPTYSMYPELASNTDTKWITVPSETDFELNESKIISGIISKQPDIVVINNPNNPTGKIISSAKLEKIISVAPKIVLIDEAYGEFNSQCSAIRLLAKYSNKLIVSRTLSKAFSFAGVRIGYLIGYPPITTALLITKLPYNISEISAKIAEIAVINYKKTLDKVPEIIRQREILQVGLTNLGFKCIKSEANFILFGQFVDNQKAWQYYLDNSILIRDVNIPGFLRVSVGDEIENQTFLSVSAKLADRVGLI